MQNTKHSKERSFECRKLKFSALKAPNHCRDHEEKHSSFEENKYQSSAKKKTKHLNLAQTKSMQHLKKIKSNKKKISETSCYPTLNVK